MSSELRKVVFLSNHVYGSRRRAGFHWLADAFYDAGWKVGFVTTGLSHISRVQRDRRLSDVKSSERGRCIEAKPNFWTLVDLTSFHPLDLRLKIANAVVTPLYRAYGRKLSPVLRDMLQDADVVVFESSAALMYVDTVRAANPRAKLVYRVSDDVRVIRFHPIIRETEDRVLGVFDCVSVPSSILYKRYSHLSAAAIHPHGLNKKAMDDAGSSNPLAPYSGINAVSVGSTLFDNEFLAIAANVRPDINFHVIGDVSEEYSQANIIQHGELPFAQAAAFTMNADIGLALYRHRVGAEYLAETSNKISQYIYARLPIVAPAFVSPFLRAPSFSYELNDYSVRAALDSAINFDRDKIDITAVPTWRDVMDGILKVVGMLPRV